MPFSRLWYGEPNALSNAIGYAKVFSRSHDAVIRVYDEAGPFLSSLRRSKILVRRTPDIASLSFTLGYRDFVNVAPLHLGEKFAQAHRASPGVLMGVNIFSTSASKRGSLRIGSHTGSSL